MKIIFNLFRVGLGNNGGSRTIIKSAEILSKLGQEVVLFMDKKNKYTWEKINKDVKIVSGKSIPSGDVIIATGYKSVKSTISSKIKKKFYFIRGFELWQASKEDLLMSYKSLSCIVNSSWLHNMLKNNGIASEIVYNGLDFDSFYNLHNSREDILGGLYSKKHKTKRYIDCVEVAKYIKKPLLSLNKDIKNPRPKTLNNWYNNIMFWMSPTELEGLHNPPMEASLCGCGLVVTDNFRSGTSDYVIPNETALVYKQRDIEGAGKCVLKMMKDKSLRERLNNNMISLLREKIGTREKNMKKFLSIIKI